MFSQGEGSWMVLPNGKQTTIKTKRFMIEGARKKQANTKKEPKHIVRVKGKYS
jgi:hypothetical protein